MQNQQRYPGYQVLGAKKKEDLQVDTGSAREGEAACPEKVGLDTEGSSTFRLELALWICG